MTSRRISQYTSASVAAMLVLGATMVPGAAADTPSISLSTSTLPLNYAGPQTITVKGTGTHFNAGTVVYVLNLSTNTNTNAASNFVNVDSSTEQFMLASGLPAGTYEVQVVSPQPDGSSETETATLTVSRPSASVTPSSLSTSYADGTQLVVTLNGMLLDSNYRVQLLDNQMNDWSSQKIESASFSDAGTSATLTLTLASGLPSGTYTIQITDGTAQASASFAVNTVTNSSPLSFTTESLPGATPGQPYTATIAANQAATWSVSNLPSWLNMTVSADHKSITLSTPTGVTVPSNFSGLHVTVTATPLSGGTAVSQLYTISVNSSGSSQQSGGGSSGGTGTGGTSTGGGDTGQSGNTSNGSGTGQGGTSGGGSSGSGAGGSSGSNANGGGGSTGGSGTSAGGTDTGSSGNPGSGSSGGTTGSGSGGSPTNSGTGTSGTGSGSGGSSSSTSSDSGLFQKSLGSATVTPAGGKLEKRAGSADVTLTIPSHAFSHEVQVTLTSADPNVLANIVPKDDQVVCAFGVEFSGATPSQPVELVIRDPNIPAGAQVFKVTRDGTLVPVSAQATAGQVVIRFTSDPDFVIVAPKKSTTGTSGAGSGGPSDKSPGGMPSYRRVSLIVGGKRVAVVPAFTAHNTTYMPIWYVQQALARVGVKSTWDGHNWRMTTSRKASLSQISPGKGSMSLYLNGKLVQKVDGMYEMDPSTGRMTTYMPIWYLMQVLKRLHIQSSWDGTNWNIQVR